MGNTRKLINQYNNSKYLLMFIDKTEERNEIYKNGTEQIKNNHIRMYYFNDGWSLQLYYYTETKDAGYLHYITWLKKGIRGKSQRKHKQYRNFYQSKRFRKLRKALIRHRVLKQAL